MAATIASSTIFQSAGTTALSFAFTAPTGVAEDDLEIIIVAIGTGSGVTINTPSGWTALWNDVLSAGVVQNHAAFWRLAPASNGTVNVTISSAYNKNCVGARLRITGHHATTPIDVTSALSSGAATPNASPSWTVNGANTTQADVLALAWTNWPWGQYTGAPFAVPSGWTAGPLNHSAHYGSEQPAAGLWTKTIASAGATGNAGITPQGIDAGDGNSRSWGGRVLGIAPSAAAPPAVDDDVVCLVVG